MNGDWTGDIRIYTADEITVMRLQTMYLIENQVARAAVLGRVQVCDLTTR